jgi:hypothetical protein
MGKLPLVLGARARGSELFETWLLSDPPKDKPAQNEGLRWCLSYVAECLGSGMVPHHFEVMVVVMMVAAAAARIVLQVVRTARLLLGRRIVGGRIARGGIARWRVAGGIGRRGRRGAAGAVGDVRGRGDGDGALGKAIDRGRCGHRRRGTDIGAAADRRVVATDVVGLGGKARSGREDLRVVGRERRAGVAVGDAGEPICMAAAESASKVPPRSSLPNRALKIPPHKSRIGRHSIALPSKLIPREQMRLPVSAPARCAQRIKFHQDAACNSADGLSRPTLTARRLSGGVDWIL